jgi:hypothetical protein
MRRTLAVGKVLVLACVVWLTGMDARAQASVHEDDKYQRAFDESVDKGLAFLARSQAADGSIGGATTPAITSLAIMAFLARGYSPGVPPYGDVINRGIDHILSQSKPNGLLMGQNGRMYSHNISTLMLSEASGMVDPERQARIDNVLSGALRIILAAQDVTKGEANAGGWRYEPSSSDSDISMAGWALASLRSARNNGAPVPKEAVDKAVKYILRCRVKEGGGFAYQPGGGANLARTGIGLLCLELAGRHRDEVTLAAGKYIAGKFKDSSSLNGESCHYYTFYYMANGMFQLGGPEWESFAPRLYDSILKMQGPDGSWPTKGSHTPNTQYATSMAILSLSVSYRQLPIYQR